MQEQILTQEQTLVQQQQQRLTAQQILQVKLLEMPLAQLEESVKTELYENPALESEHMEEPDYDVRTADGDLGVDESNENEDFDAENERQEREDALDSALESIDSDDRMATDYREMSYNGTADHEEMVYGDTVSFYDKLMEQVNDEDLDDHQRAIMEYIVGSLDDDGLLRTSTAFIADDLAIYHGIDASEQEILNVLAILQTFDPAGIGARSLQECLLLQIARREDTRQTRLMRKTIRDYFDEFTKKHWEKIRQHLRISEGEADEVIAELRRLNPRPGSSMGETMGRGTQQVTPDFIVDTTVDGNVTFQLNNGDLPRLFISRDFEEQMKGFQKNQKSMNRMEKEALLYTKEKIERARGYIEAVEKRRHTLTVTMKAIIDLQRKYFTDGDDSELQPMTLKDIADRVGLDISTISRVCNAKYAETPWGIFRLRHFFSSGYSVDGEEEMSNRRIKAALAEVIEAEDKKHPLSDDVLSKVLKEKGFPIARRTVAKYREALGYPVARLRK